MALDDIVRGIEIVLRVAASRTDDIAAAEGRDQLMERPRGRDITGGARAPSVRLP